MDTTHINYVHLNPYGTDDVREIFLQAALKDARKAPLENDLVITIRRVQQETK